MTQFLDHRVYLQAEDAAKAQGQWEMQDEATDKLKYLGQTVNLAIRRPSSLAAAAAMPAAATGAQA